MNKLLKIGEMAELFNLNVRTLRYYDEIGLLKPVYVDPVSNYRYYAIEQFEQLNSIRYLRTQNMSLQDIYEVLKHRNPVRMRNLMVQQIEKVTKQIEELQNIKLRLEHRVTQIDYAMDDSFTGKIRFDEFSGRAVTVFRKVFNAGDDLEMHLRNMEIDNKLQPSYFLGKVGISMSLENLIRGDFSRYQGLFCILEAGEKTAAQTAMLPAGLWAIWRFHGSHKDSGPQYKKLLEMIAEKGMKPCGNAAEFSLLDAGLTENPSEYTAEIQIPVQTV